MSSQSCHVQYVGNSRTPVLVIDDFHEDCAEIAEGVLDVFQVNGFACKVLQIVHDYLFSVWHKNGNPIVF